MGRWTEAEKSDEKKRNTCEPTPHKGPTNKPDELLLARVEDLERRIARLMAGLPSDTFPWEVLDTMLDNLMSRDQFKMKTNGSCNNITIWRMLTRLKEAREKMLLRGG